MTATLYGNAALKMAKGEIDWDLITLKAMICAAGYTPNFDTDDFRADVTNEVSGAGYTAGGVALTGEAVSLVTASNRVKFDADDADFGTVTFTAGTQMVVYIDTGNAATDILWSHHTFPSAQSPAASPFKYVFNADGIGYVTY